MDLQQISPAASEAFAPLFGINCKKLSRQQATNLIQDVMRFVDDPCDLDWNRTLIEGKYPVAKHTLDAIDNLYKLSKTDLLGLVEFLGHQLRVGRWAGIIKQIEYFADERGFLIQFGESESITTVEIGWLDGWCDYSRKGDANYILGLLQQYKRRGYVPSQEACNARLETLKSKFDTIELLIVEMMAIIDEDSKMRFSIPLPDRELEDWRDFLASFQGNLAKIQVAIDNCSATVKADVAKVEKND